MTETNIPKPPRRGRPRRLELDQVIEAALTVGLQHLTMASVAKRLGVSKAVLYGYVESREELVQLASAHAARRHRFPSDYGQPWTMWVLEYARALFEVMTMDGQLLETWLSGNQSPIVEVDAAEGWLQALTSRGFSGEETLQLRRAVSNIVIGAAASMKREHALRKEGRPRSVSARKAVLARASKETTLLRQFVDIFAREMSEQSWEFGIYILLQGVSVAREALQIREDADPTPFEKG